jgi:translocation and assembly module TamB
MKRLTRQLLAVMLLLALTGLAIAGVNWVMATTQGARWLLTTVSTASGIRLSMQGIEGTLANRLTLTKLRLDLAQQTLESDRLELRWRPLSLLTGSVAVQELRLNGVRIQDNAPYDNRPPELTWPKAPGFSRLVEGTISSLQVTDFSYRSLQEPPLLLKSVTAALAWQHSRLSIKDLTVVSADGQLAGSVSAGFGQPSLTADLLIALPRPVGGMDRFSMQIRPGVGKGTEPFTATITLDGAAGRQKLLELSGAIGMTKQAFNLRQLRLTRPGQKGLLTADGSLAFTGKESVLTLQTKLAGLNLAPDLQIPTDLSGTLTFVGTADRYQGRFNFSNRAKGWQSATIAADYQGNRNGMQLAPLTGALLDGSLGGSVTLDWRNGFAMQGALQGRKLNPARIDPGWSGMANFNASGKLAWSGSSPLKGNVSATLLESHLHGQDLTGKLQAELSKNSLFLNRLTLHGKGFDLRASGKLDQRLAIATRISDFSRLIPGAAGSLQADGWISWKDGQLNGAGTGTGSRLAYGSSRLAAADLTVRHDQGSGAPLQLAGSARDLTYDGYHLDAVTFTADGTLPRHTIQATLRSSAGEAQLALAAGYDSKVWKGQLTRLSGRDSFGPWQLSAPAVFSISAANLSVAPVLLTAGPHERLELSLNLALQPLTGQVRAHWAGLNLGRANPWLKAGKLSGSSHGTVRATVLSGKRLDLSGSAGVSGRFSMQGAELTLKRGQITFDGTQQGLRVATDLEMADGGRLKGSFVSAVPSGLVIPDKGDLSAEFSRFDLAQLKPWLPPDTLLTGQVSGQTTGRMLPGQRFELDGDAVLSGGTVQQKRAEGDLQLAFKSATANWSWRGEKLSGQLALTMAEYGKLRGEFQLPLPARLPVAINPKGTLRVAVNGQAQEKGLLTTLFPGFIQESFGTLDADLLVSGVWAAPQVNGTLRLSKAGAYLPTAGIQLKEVQLSARLAKDRISIDSFRAVSGPGHIEGTALLTLDGWQLRSYQGTIAGANFQTVHFPELHLLTTPKLRFEGTAQKLTVRGELRLPELNITGAQSRSVIMPSSDVIREGKTAAVVRPSTLALDLQIKLLLGEKVFVKVSGIDARLAGALDLSMSRLDRITSKGEIKVVKGNYRTYGVNLDIVRGRLFFAGGPVNRPSLDFLALRTVGDVRAGVTVTGTIQKPVTRLYSEPAMSDIDILAYIVFGHPLGSSTAQASLVTQAAGALLTSGQAAVLQEQLKNKLGISTLEIQGGVGKTSGAMGYKPLQVTPPGTIPAAQQPGITETVLTVGTFLTPQLYISYGKSLFTGGNLFRLRYDIFKHWQIETQTGSDASGADLYYTLEFK